MKYLTIAFDDGPSALMCEMADKIAAYGWHAAFALIGRKIGADYVAPYVNRLDNIIGDGTEVVAQIVEQFAIYDLPCKVIAASFKNAEQVHRCAMSGCQCVTVNADILKAVISHPMTDSAIDGFNKDWASVYGNKTILDF